ncbi:MAG: efflux RND transporter periplasmic adaptor subunit, partial [Proteobacteria bacterium]|nr:efflux RND transporter periplasmic adaptor subunit [Pseudomonadota bacterium]
MIDVFNATATALYPDRIRDRTGRMMIHDRCNTMLRGNDAQAANVSTLRPSVLLRQVARYGVLTALVLPLIAAACKRDEKVQAPVPRPVRTITVKPSAVGETVTLTGHIDAQDSSAMAFRIGGRMIQRFVNVGDAVKPGQELARLDAANELNALRSAQAQQSAAQAQLTQARAAFERQRTLLAQGHTPRAQFEIAEKALNTAIANADAAEVNIRVAADRVSYTVLQADAAGTVTARGAEPGEVVQAGQMVVTIAKQNGRDAVFDVP